MNFFSGWKRSQTVSLLWHSQLVLPKDAAHLGFSFGPLSDGLDIPQWLWPTLGLCIIGANLTSIPATMTFLLIVVMVWGTIETSWCQIARPLSLPGCYLIFIMVPLLWTLICKKKTKTLSFCRGHFHTSVSLLPIPLCSGTLCFFLSSSLGKKSTAHTKCITHLTSSLLKEDECHFAEEKPRHM